MNKEGKERVKALVAKVAEGNDGAFTELRDIAQPLTSNLSNYFSQLHYKFEYDDFYSICLNGLYQACLSFDDRNPCFLSFAKVVMTRACWREVDYWNMEMRNIFKVQEVSIVQEWVDKEEDLGASLQGIYDDKELDACDILLYNEYRSDLAQIIDEVFDSVKAEVIKLYLFDDMSVSNISKKCGLKYKNTYSIITRGVSRVQKEYSLRFLDKS